MLSGTVRVPGDKSISHRALILAALAVGESRIEGLNDGADVAATAAALGAMGARIERAGGEAWVVRGVGTGALLQPEGPLDLGNAGTGARLLMGLVASHPIDADFTGDESLCRRPMGRLAEPLRRIGARVEGERLPLRVEGVYPAIPTHHRLHIPSAQVKSALLLAGLNTPGITRVESPPSRDHLERMLPSFGVPVERAADCLSIRGEAELRPARIRIPGDVSAAAFLVVAALIVPGAAIRIDNVGVNPTRIGLFEVLREMGAEIAFENERETSNEPVADLVVRHSALTGVDVPAEIAPRMIDEYPILCVAAAFARGDTRMRGLAELRVKESDRLAAMAPLGARVEGDDLIIAGSGGAPLAGGFIIDAAGDHRIAMAFTVAGLRARAPIGVAAMDCIATSFPGFAATLRDLGRSAMIIAVDGPAASGKGTIARALAAHFGLPHMDTGLLYRAAAFNLMEMGGDPESEFAAARAAADLALIDFDNIELKSETVGNIASRISAYPLVRETLFERQQRFAASPGGAVLDGRDIGTVIAPEAEVKLFVSAAPEIRARRRFDELKARGLDVHYDDVLADIRARDERDANRDAAPLVMAEGAVLLDTSAMSAEEAVTAAVAAVKRAQ